MEQTKQNKTKRKKNNNNKKENEMKLQATRPLPFHLDQSINHSFDE